MFSITITLKMFAISRHVVFSFLVCASGSAAFQGSFHINMLSEAKIRRPPSSLKLQLEETSQHHFDRLQKSFRLSQDEISPIIRFGKGEKEKVINAHGLWCVLITILTCPVWLVAMTILNFVNENVNSEWDPNFALYDKTGKIWSKTWLTLANSYPTASGEVDFLKGEGRGPCLFVANHASWFDIPVLCTVLDPVFKFIAKGELLKVPCIGQQLEGVSVFLRRRFVGYVLIESNENGSYQGHHILIDREDRRSQLRTFKEGINWLKKGVPIMAFPEGQRSPDGRLIDFKGGVFSMAVKTGVPIVPLSISHTHAVMPPNALFPVQSGRGKLHVHVHSPIESAGRTDAELADLVRQAFLSELPLDHLPLDMTQEELITSSAIQAIQIETASQVSKEQQHSTPQDNRVLKKANQKSILTQDEHHAPLDHSEKPLPLYAIDVKEELVEKV